MVGRDEHWQRGKWELSIVIPHFAIDMFFLPILILAGNFASTPPIVGDRAPGFDVRTLGHESVRLSSLLKHGPVVLVVLRGYPGYQCPFCTRQVGEILSKSPEFEKRKASVVLVYPGPAENLEKYASEFVSGKDIPKGVYFTLDPDYGFTKSYCLRWEAPHETAYPSAFVIRKDRRIVYAKVSRSHGDRAPLEDILKGLDSL